MFNSPSHFQFGNNGNQQQGEQQGGANPEAAAVVIPNADALLDQFVQGIVPNEGIQPLPQMFDEAVGGEEPVFFVRKGCIKSLRHSSFFVSIRNLQIGSLTKNHPKDPVLLALFIEAGVSKNDYQTLRNTAVANGSVLIPPYSTVAAAKLQCYPNDMVFTNPKAEVPLQSLLDHTASHLLFGADPKHMEALEDMANIQLVLKYGMYGIGS
ncbi:hypothetical protein FOCC_FOCC013141 [Frankliniella occidentalis]|nr:hypothetical protein FOCC_FOCC013141 [Frankliniella occidentalis]